MDDVDNPLLHLFDDTHEEKTDRQSIIRAPFGIPGTKTRSIEHLKLHLPYRNKWVDCFCGSGVVTFNRRPSPVLEVMNDRYGGITDFYKCLRDADKWQAVQDYLENTLHSRQEFYEARDLWCSETDPVIRAAKWYYMVRTSVIGKKVSFARQTNSKAQFPVAAALPGFFGIHQRLKNVIVENLDFETCLKDFDSDDCVHYLDPPYLNTDGGVYEHKWTKDDQERLVRAVSRCKGFVALSGYANEINDSQTFWDERITWKVKANAEVKAFTAENYRIGRENVQEVDDVEECLWIRN